MLDTETIHMPKERKFNLYTPEGFAGTYTMAQLRQMMLDGHVPRNSNVAEVRGSILAARQLSPVPITSLPEVADLDAYLTEAETIPASLTEAETRPASAMPTTAITATQPEITRRSGWSGVLIFIGVLSLVGGILGAVIGTSAMILVLGLVGAIQAFFFAFLVDVFTDIRWFLKKLVERSDGNV
jgi:hypothetical protein